MALLPLLEPLRVLLQQAQDWVLLAFHLLDQWLAPMLPPTCLRQGPFKLVSGTAMQRGPEVPWWDPPLPLCNLVRHGVQWHLGATKIWHTHKHRCSPAGSWFALAQSAAMGGSMLVALPVAVVTGGQREHIYKGASWVYNRWAVRSAEDEAKQTPDAEDEAKQTSGVGDEAKQTADNTS